MRLLLMTIAAMGLVCAAGCSNGTETTMNEQAKTPNAPDAAETPKAAVTDVAAGGEEPTLSGRCHCGAVTYQATGPVQKSSYCGCPACQKATGALKIPFVTVKRSQLTLSDDPAVYKATGGEHCDEHGSWQ